MRNLHDLDRFRRIDKAVIEKYGSTGDHECGVFSVPHAGRDFLVIASSGQGWDHVSISLPTRCPSWSEMEYLKRLFFKEDETAMQLHVPPKNHISNHPYTLHLWRPTDREIPLPPAIFV